MRELPSKSLEIVALALPSESSPAVPSVATVSGTRPGPDGEERYRRSERPVGRVGLALFRRLGIDAQASPSSQPRLIELLLPSVSGMSYIRLLNSVFCDGGRRWPRIGIADETRWLASHLKLEALGALHESDPLRAMWTAACARVGVAPSEACVDRMSLEHELAELSFGADSDELFVATLARTIRKTPARV
jgi:hypothetical protein